jgi:hypothetical protein
VQGNDPIYNFHGSDSDIFAQPIKIVIQSEYYELLNAAAQFILAVLDFACETV